MLLVAWDDKEAARISEALDTWLRAHQPPNYWLPAKVERAFDQLRAQRRLALDQQDMDRWQRVHLEMMRLMMDAFGAVLERRAKQAATWPAKPR